MGGIVVSPLPLQAGARKVAEAEGIVEVQLNENSTTEEHILRFLQRVMVRLKPEALTINADVVCATLKSVSEKT